jgi:hypothetical protein
MSDRSGKYSSPVRIIRLQQETEENQDIITTLRIGQLWDKKYLLSLGLELNPKTLAYKHFPLASVECFIHTYINTQPRPTF